jgi:hypothetical protein
VPDCERRKNLVWVKRSKMFKFFKAKLMIRNKRIRNKKIKRNLLFDILVENEFPKF